MICLEHICIDPNAPDFAKPHPKQECIWNKLQHDGVTKADLTNYPNEDDALLAWKRGMSNARGLARYVGMGPNGDMYRGDDSGSSDDDDDYPGHDDDDGWFYTYVQ